MKSLKSIELDEQKFIGKALTGLILLLGSLGLFFVIMSVYYLVGKPTSFTSYEIFITFLFSIQTIMSVCKVSVKVCNA